MAHKGGDGSSPFDRMKRQGIAFRAAAENVAYGFDDVESVMAGWMRSPGHRRNILGNSPRSASAARPPGTAPPIGASHSEPPGR